jgi:hypothetical protein
MMSGDASFGDLRSEVGEWSVDNEDMDPEGARVGQGAVGMLVMFASGDQPRKQFYIR